MTIPTLMKLPHLNLEAFQKALDRTLVQVDGQDIKTRAEVRLDDTLRQLAQLDIDGAEARQEIAKTKTAIAQLQDLLIRQESVESDIALERNALIQLQHALQQSGVTLPQTETTS